MTPAARAITELYRLGGAAFERQFTIMTINVSRQLLEDVVRAPMLYTNADDLLGDMSSALIKAQLSACEEAQISEGQRQDFLDRMGNSQADAIVSIRDSYERFQDRTSQEFQLDAAQRLGIPVA